MRYVVMRKVAKTKTLKIPVTLKIKRDVLDFMNKELGASDLNGTASAVITASVEMLMRSKCETTTYKR